MGLRFSIVTVVYNGEKEIAKTIESVLAQTVPPFEYIIVDGKSTDNTLNIVGRYVDLLSKKGIVLRIISEKDTGIYNAMNKGIDVATGDFISFLNVGDWYEPTALQDVNCLYEKKPFDLTYGSIFYHLENGKVLIKKSRKDHIVVSSRNWNHPSMFLKSDIYKRYHFDETLKIYSDFDLFLKLRKNKQVKILVNKLVTTHFISGGVSTNPSSSKVRMKEKAFAYRHNHYNFLCLLEVYFWETFKRFFFKVNK